MVNFFKPSLTAEMRGMIVHYGEFFNQIPGVVMIQDATDSTIAFMNDVGLHQTGMSLSKLYNLSDAEFRSKFFNPDAEKNNRPKLANFIKSNSEETFSFYQQMRFPDDTHWKWYLSGIKIFMRQENNLPLLTLTISLPLENMSDLPVQVKRVLEETDFLEKNAILFSKLTKREASILREVALGKTSGEIAEKMFISPNTVDTHRRNIREKLNTKSFFDLTNYARAFDLI